MKQKLVINVTFNGNKSRSKAMKIAVGFAAVESVSIGGEGKNKIEVVGDGLDAVKLTSLLRMRVGYAVLETVAPVKKKQEKNPEAAPTTTQIQPWLWPLGPSQYVYKVRDQYSGHDPVQKRLGKKPEAAPTTTEIQPWLWPLGPSPYVYEVRDQYSGHDPNYCSIL